MPANQVSDLDDEQAGSRGAGGRSSCSWVHALVDRLTQSPGLRAKAVEGGGDDAVGVLAGEGVHCAVASG